MRAEDKRVGFDKDEVETAQRIRQDRAQGYEDRLEEGDDLATQSDEVESAKRERCASMMQIVDSIFRKDVQPLAGVTVSGGFSADEVRALQFLQAAVTGRDLNEAHIVYAEDREDLLEQALAVLYPTLSHGREQSASALWEQHDAIVEKVSLLREQIASKEDAQEDIIEARQRIEETKGDDDKDDDEDDQGDGDADETAASGEGDPTDEEEDDDATPGDGGDPGAMP